jgi:hypothetical protein
MRLRPLSEGAVLVVLLVFTVATVGQAAPVTVVDVDAPEEAEIGEEVTVGISLTDQDVESDDWTLSGSTQLKNVTKWEVTKIQVDGSEETETFSDQQEFETSIQTTDNLVRVTITGTVPAVESYNYRSKQTFVAADLDRVDDTGENDIGQVEVHHYTDESRNARQQITEAINETDSSEAQLSINRAISAYNSANFENAVALAEDALDDSESGQDTGKTENTADTDDIEEPEGDGDVEDDDESEQTDQTAFPLLPAGGAVLAIVLIGGVYYYRSQQMS